LWQKSDSSLLLNSYEFRRKVRHKQVLFTKEIVRKYIDCDKFVWYIMFVVFLEVALGVVTQSVTISRNCKQDYDFAANQNFKKNNNAHICGEFCGKNWPFNIDGLKFRNKSKRYQKIYCELLLLPWWWKYQFSSLNVAVLFNKDVNMISRIPNYYLTLVIFLFQPPFCHQNVLKSHGETTRWPPPCKLEISNPSKDWKLIKQTCKSLFNTAVEFLFFDSSWNIKKSQYFVNKNFCYRFSILLVVGI